MEKEPPDGVCPSCGNPVDLTAHLPNIREKVWKITCRTCNTMLRRADAESAWVVNIPAPSTSLADYAKRKEAARIERERNYAERLKRETARRAAAERAAQ